MQRKHMSFEREIPHQGIEIIGLVIEIDVEVVGQYIGNLIKAFQPAIVVYNCFGAAEVGT
jgi:hypothetical protein